MRSRALIYFGSVLATIALINTPVPKIVVSAVLNPEAGDAVARSLSSITKDLVLVLLISLYFEWARTRGQAELLRDIARKLDAMRDEARTASASSTRRLVLDATTPEELVTTALDRHIPRTPDKSSLVSLAVSSRPACHDVTLSLWVERVDETAVHAATRVELTMPREPMLVAATASSTHSAALSAACPELFQTVSLGRPHSFEEAAKEFGEKLECYVESQNRATRRAQFRRVPANGLRKYISPPVGMTNADVALFVADLGHEDTEFVRVRYHYYWSQDLDQHFIFWAADRPSFIRTLTLDLRELVRDREQQVWVQVFLGSLDSLLLDDANDGHLSLNLNRWVVEGQGVVAVW